MFLGLLPLDLVTSVLIGLPDNMEADMGRVGRLFPGLLLRPRWNKLTKSLM